MSEISETVAELKQMARAQRLQGQYREAEKVLKQAIAALNGSMDTSPPNRREAVAAEIADVWGMLGGVFKAQHDLAASARAYDSGYRYESDSRFNVASSYNALNRLVMRILICPQVLTASHPISAPPALDEVDVPNELSKLRATLQTACQSARKSDYWAAADLAVVCALVGEDVDTENAARHFTLLSPPPHAYKACRETVSALADVALDRKPSLEKLEQWLTITS